MAPQHYSRQKEVGHPHPFENQSRNPSVSLLFSFRATLTSNKCMAEPSRLILSSHWVNPQRDWDGTRKCRRVYGIGICHRSPFLPKHVQRLPSDFDVGLKRDANHRTKKHTPQ